MKLLYLIPGRIGPGFDQEEIERRETVLQTMCSPMVTVNVRVSGEGPLSIESLCDEAWSAPSMLKAAKEAEMEGYDGIIIGCAGDPCADAVKEAVSIPVVAPGQSSYAIASLLGRRFSVVTPVKGTVGTTLDLIAKYGYKDSLASVENADISVLEITSNPSRAKECAKNAAERAIKDAGADVIVLGCMSLAFAKADETLSKETGIPVVNPVKSALFLLESLVKMEITQSREAYPLWDCSDFMVL